MKGSFWKKNIKEMKKEKKERRIKQKILRMELEKTSSNELKSVVSDKKESQQEILQEEKVEPEPVVEYCKFLLDTNILDDMFSVKEGYVVTTMMDHWNNPSREWNVHRIKFLTLDNIIDEFTHMKKHKKTFDQKSRFRDVCGYLSSIGKFECVYLDNDSAYAHRAIKLFESEKYKSENDEPLSKADCYLLEYAIEYSCKLVTHDKALLKATKKEIREQVGENTFDVATSAGVFDPTRT